MEETTPIGLCQKQEEQILKNYEVSVVRDYKELVVLLCDKFQTIEERKEFFNRYVSWFGSTILVFLKVNVGNIKKVSYFIQKGWL